MMGLDPKESEPAKAWHPLDALADVLRRGSGITGSQAVAIAQTEAAELIVTWLDGHKELTEPEDELLCEALTFLEDAAKGQNTSSGVVGRVRAAKFLLARETIRIHANAQLSAKTTATGVSKNLLGDPRIRGDK